MSRPERRMAEAKKLEDRLKSRGEHMHAQTVKDLRLSLSAARSTLSALHRENMELREKLKAHG